MTIKQTTDKAAIVQTDIKYIDAKEHPPARNAKMICISKAQGVAVVSTWSDEFGFTHWHPLPTF